MPSTTATRPNTRRGTSSPYAGPTLAISDLQNTLVSSGPNAGKLIRYYLYDSQLRGAFDYDSLGGCTIDDSYTYDPVTFASATLDYCNAYFTAGNGQSGAGFVAPTRSELQVDGADAYTAGNESAMFSGFNALAGFPSLTYSYSIDPATGNLVLFETDQVVKCSPGGYPATSGNCTSLVPTGVQVKMRITQGASGRVATVAQYFSSTDGRSHAVDLLEDNEFRHYNDDDEWNFPWTGAGLQPYTVPGQVIPGPSASGPGSFFVKGSASVPDGGESAAQGAVTFSNPPSSETVIGTTTNSSSYSWVDLHYARTVPASGSVVLGFTYSNAFLASEVAGYAAAAQAAYRPSVTIGSATGSKSGAVVTGTAHDATGLSSVTVNGHAAPLGSNGTWKAKVPLGKGLRTVTAVATNVFGNTAQSVVTLPAIAKAKQSHSSWSSNQGTTFSFKLSETASVTFTFTRKHGHHTMKVGKFKFSGHAGKNKRKFKGVLGKHKTLKPGKYTLVITARSGTLTSRPAQLTFTIL